MLALLVFSILRSLLQIAFLPLGVTHRPSPAGLPSIPARDHIEWARYGFVTPATERCFDKQAYFAVVVGAEIAPMSVRCFRRKGFEPWTCMFGYVRVQHERQKLLPNRTFTKTVFVSALTSFISRSRVHFLVVLEAEVTGGCEITILWFSLGAKMRRMGPRLWRDSHTPCSLVT